MIKAKISNFRSKRDLGLGLVLFWLRLMGREAKEMKWRMFGD